MSIEATRRLIAADMDQVDAIIRERLHSEVPLIWQVGEHIINGGGKRLRPALLLLAAGSFGYAGDAQHRLAAAVEFIHTATLLHDDVVDESAMRRGRKTANSLYGNAASVLVGDFLYTRAFQMMVAVNDMAVMGVLADATNTIAQGEVMQLLNRRNADLDEAAYLRVVQCKTAKLFEAAAKLGSLLGGATGPQVDALGAYGMHLGTAFQLVDDVLDYSGEPGQIGKNLGDDLAEGKSTLPLIYALRAGTAAQQATVRAAVEAGGLNDFAPVLEAVRDTGAFDYTRARARAHADQAVAALAALPRSTHKDCLLQLADFSVTRDY